MIELKTVVVLDGKIIHVGEWDYQFIEVGGEKINPLPKGATIEQREMELIDGVWQELGYVPSISDKDRIEQLEQMINLILLGEV